MRVGEDKTLTLKNGEVVNAREGVCAYHEILFVAEKHPQHIRVLRDIAAGKAQGHSPESVAFLKRTRYLDRKGSIRRPLIGQVALCSVADTPEGQVLVNPFQLKDESERRLVDEIVGSFLTVPELMRELFRDDPNEPPGRG